MHKAARVNRLYKVLMVGGSTVSRVLVESILTASTDFSLVGAVNGVTDLASAVDDIRPDIVLIDLCAAHVDGAGALSALQGHGSVRKIVLTPELLPEPDRRHLAEAGAIAFVQKRAVAEDHDGFRQKLRMLVGLVPEWHGDGAAEADGTEQRPMPVVPVSMERAVLRSVPLGVDMAPGIVPATSICCPDEELMRQAALDALAIANADRDRRCDLVVKHLAHVTGYSMAAMTLIDQSVQWVKAGWGLARKPLPRESAICNHTIRHATPLIVADTLDHPIFSRFDWVTGEPHIRSYVGVPLIVECGFAIGALCLMDTRPRACVQTEISVLSDMAALIVEMLDKPRERIAA